MAHSFQVDDNPAIDAERIGPITAPRIPDCPWPIKNQVVLRSGIRCDEAWILVNQTVADTLLAETSSTATIKVSGRSLTGWYCVKRWKVFAGNTPMYYLKFVDRRGLVFDSPVSSSLDIQDLVDTLGTGATVGTINKIFELHFGVSSITQPTPLNTSPTVVSTFDKTVGQLLQIMVDHHPAILLRDPETNTYSLSALTTETTESATKFLATHENDLMPRQAIKTVRVSDAASAGSTYTLTGDGLQGFNAVIDNMDDGLSYQSVADAVEYMYNRSGKLLALPYMLDRKPSATFDTITFRDRTTIIETAVIPRCNYEPAGTGSEGESGGSSNTIVEFRAAAFTTSNSSFTAFVTNVYSGTGVSVSDAITVQNRQAVNGVSGVYAYAAPANTTGVAILGDDESWHILDLTATACECIEV